MDSRHLGEIVLEGGPGGGWLDTTVEVAGAQVPFRLEIDYPGRFDEKTVNKIDLALDSLVALDKGARTLITTALQQSDSAPAQLFEKWTQPGSADDFVQQLHPTKITLLPDGGRDTLDRIVMVYQLPGAPSSEKITVRFKERIGAELDPAPRGEYA